MVQKGDPVNYAARLERLRRLLTSLPCDALLIEHPTHLLYLTGLELSTGKLLISEHKECLIVDGRYFEKSCLQTLYPVQLLKEDLFKQLMTSFQIHQLGFDEHQTTYHAFLSLTQTAASLKSQSYDLKIVPIESPVQKLRLIKDEDEISCLRAAARLGYQGYEFVVSQLREGITEAELAFELEFFWKKRGGSRLAFESIIAFGPNSSMPHYRAGDAKLKQDTAVLIDIGVVLAHYHSDMTRTIFYGTPPPLVQEIYTIVEEAKARALALCRPGTLIGELDRTAREWIASKGYRDYFTHSLGHGIGLDIHEPPTVRETGPYSCVSLQPGMVLTIEPGIYLPEIGGVRLEDTVLITETGYDNLTT
jgi:Xaa-Pro aminopeptidase